LIGWLFCPVANSFRVIQKDVLTLVPTAHDVTDLA
jgi:hypothetical protein